MRQKLHPVQVEFPGIQPPPEPRLDARQDGPVALRMEHRWLPIAASLSLLAACGGAGDAPSSPAAEEKVVHVYNWVDYVGPTTIADFEARTGIRVVYDTYDANEILETKMLTGRSGYDVVFPSAVPLARQIGAGAIGRLDKSKLPNLVHMDPVVMERIALNDPGNAHAIPYMWGTAGIGYNPDKVEKALGTRTIDSWSAIFDPAIAAKLSKCGIAMMDVPEDTFMVARTYLGLDANSEKPEDLAAAEELLKRVRPYIRYFNTSQLMNDLASGEVCVAFSWNGYLIQARDRGAAAANPVKLAYAIPKEGTFIWFDTVGDPGRCAASRERARLPRLPDGAGSHRESQQPHRLCERQPRLPRVPRRPGPGRSRGVST